jgi:hypothetical protein
MIIPLDCRPKLIRREPLKHDRLSKRCQSSTHIPARLPRLSRGSGSVTVCIAALINWIYPNQEIGRAVIAVADRMLTSGSGDIEYEPAQLKLAFLRRRIVLLAAGDITIHTEALTLTSRSLASEPTDDVEDVAELYATSLRRIKNRRAYDRYLSPLNLDEHSFLTRQSEMVPNLVFELANQLQDYWLNVEALVVGCDDRLLAHIFHIDGEGNKTFHDDINFAAIGIGSNHAKSYFMASRYPRVVNYYRALPILYAAKRRAEVAPGVGKESDWILITRDGWHFIYPNIIAELGTAYDDIEKTSQQKFTDLEERLRVVAEAEDAAAKAAAASTGGQADAARDTEQTAMVPVVWTASGEE